MKSTLHPKQLLAFILSTMAFCCQKELNFEKLAATGTLKDSSGICFPQTIHGTFHNGVTPGSDTAYVELKVNVTTSGRYLIFTDTQNGFRFSDSGNFTNTGINLIKLKATGTPLANIPTNFTIRFDTSVCSLTINVFDSAMLNQPLYNWKFTDTKRGLTYMGIFEDNYFYGVGSFQVLVLSTKKAQAPGDSTFMININLPFGNIEAGTYYTDIPPNGIVFRTFSDACINCAGGGLIPISSGVSVAIIITDYNPTTKIVKGTFSGTTIDWFDEIATIKGGEFSAEVK